MAREKNKHYWKAIRVIADIKSCIADIENESSEFVTEEERAYREKCLKGGYGLVEDLKSMLYDQGYTEQEIESDVNQTQI